LLQRVLVQWNNGLSTRLAAKILRKWGIHPWSLYWWMDVSDRPRYARDFWIPAWLSLPLNDFPEGMLLLFGKDRPFRLPNDLVIKDLHIRSCSRVKRLPRRMWVSHLEVTDCVALESASYRGGRPLSIELNNCPRLRDCPGQIEVGELKIDRCPGIRTLPMARNLHEVDLRKLNLSKVSLRGMRVGYMKIWQVAGLLSLEGSRVGQQLVLHDCPDLDQLPEMTEELTGSVTDCPNLLCPWDLRIPKGLRVKPLAEVNSSPESGNQLARPEVLGVPLFSGEEIEEDPIWPWPPIRFGGKQLDSGFRILSSALDLGPHEQVLMLMNKGLPMSKAVRQVLATEPTPAKSLRAAVALLMSCAQQGDLPLAQVTCLEVERLGCGASFREAALHFHLPGGFPIDLDRFLGAFWPGPDSDGPKDRMSGNQVIFGSSCIVRNLDLQWLDGPMWADIHLWIMDCPRLLGLPSRLKVDGDLEIRNCPVLARFPSWLEVRGDLILEDLPRLRVQNPRMSVGGELRIAGVPGFSSSQKVSPNPPETNFLIR
jgi:hypothetical protein